MPIIIPREGAAIPKVTSPLTQQQKDELWANIIRSWVDRHPDAFRGMLEDGVPAGREAVHA